MNLGGLPVEPALALTRLMLMVTEGPSALSSWSCGHLAAQGICSVGARGAPGGSRGGSGWLTDSETHSLSSSVSSFLQPPIGRMTGDLFRNKTSCLLCGPTSSFLNFLGSPGHSPTQGQGPSALPVLWPSPGHPCLGFGRLGGGILCTFGNRECSMESFLLRRLLFLPVQEALTDGCRPGDP